MEPNVIELVAQYGVSGSLLLIVFWWLARHYLPEHQRQHREELERILASHDRNTNRLVDAVDRNSRIVQFNSQALLVQSFTNGGLSREEAEAIAQKVQLAALGLQDHGVRGSRNG
ncbi:MAG TPA: hypothetical protein ENO21_02910 [Firmicutes bacterium]|nr:hypothetical protein [Bacillota bacterium]